MRNIFWYFKYKKAFTLVEMLISSVILWIVLLVIIQIYSSLIKMKVDIFTKSELVKNTNSIIEQVNIIMKNYTIDYEEYFNRKIVWCNSAWWNSFSWNVGTWWYCKKFTFYGNRNSITSSSNTWNNILYNCTSHDNWNWLVEKPWWNDCEWTSGTWTNYIYEEKNSWDLSNGSWCVDSMSNPWLQSFWEYKLQFWDVKWNADWNLWCLADDDDTDLWKWPVAIWDNLNVKELYLISKDWKNRIYLRRKLVSTWDFNWDGNIDYTWWEALYKLQILKLKWFDIGSGHNANSVWSTVNDGKIDTWACDASQWFICKWASIWWWYTSYKLPKDENDGWTDITTNNITFTKFNLSIFPTIKPSYWWYDTWIQISPYVRLNLQTRFYPVNYIWRVNPDKMRKYSMNIQTTFSIKPY